MINFCNLSLPTYSEELVFKKIKEVVSKSGFILGTEVGDFENELDECIKIYIYFSNNLINL